MKKRKFKIQFKTLIPAGFTLAEVLIALTVIGVISAVTVPVLMQNTNKQEYVTALKKTYSMLSQVTNQIIAEEGSPKQDEDGYTWMQNKQAVYDMYKKYLIKAKECGTGTDCFYNGVYKYLHGGNCTGGECSLIKNTSYLKLIMADGTALAFDYNISKTCRNNWDGKSDDCENIIVDINGSKGPNTAGRDLFVFVLKENGLYPRGCGNNSADCNTASGSGYGCACKVLREGAMNY